MRNKYAFALCLALVVCSMRNRPQDATLYSESSPKTMVLQVSDFLVSCNESHTMVLKGAEQAIDKGTVADVKAYGEFMVKEETVVLSEIRELAANKNISLPQQLSEDGEDDLAELGSKSGVAFNKAFIRLMESMHKQSLKDFEKAVDKLDDKEITTFASKHIHSIKLELIRLEKIKARM